MNDSKFLEKISSNMSYGYFGGKTQSLVTNLQNIESNHYLSQILFIIKQYYATFNYYKGYLDSLLKNIHFKKLNLHIANKFLDFGNGNNIKMNVNELNDFYIHYFDNLNEMFKIREKIRCLRVKLELEFNKVKEIDTFIIFCFKVDLNKNFSIFL